MKHVPLNSLEKRPRKAREDAKTVQARAERAIAASRTNASAHGDVLYEISVLERYPGCSIIAESGQLLGNVPKLHCKELRCIRVPEVSRCVSFRVVAVWAGGPEHGTDSALT